VSERILITGITGFVGSHLADYVLENHPNCEVWGIKRWHLSSKHHIQHIYHKINWVDCNILDAYSVKKMIDKVKPDRVFHLAAESFVSPSWDNPLHYMDVNYKGTVNLLEALRSIGSKAPFHIPGSGEEYGEIYEDELPINTETVMRPVNPYAVTKIAQDLIGYVYYKSYGLNVIRTRAFNHEGPRRENVFGIPWYAYQIARVEAGLQEPVLKVGHIDDKRNFTHVFDMVKAYWMATEKCEPGKLYLVGSEGDENIFTFREALEMLISMSDKDSITYESDADYIRPTNVPFLIADISDFANATGWKPTISFEVILEDTLRYWRKRVQDGSA
jgi:GDP-4-dehydro-6-deoxy-D-mannose reductase